jgi:drug/metabolite transporter (DMT)-like permease
MEDQNDINLTEELNEIVDYGSYAWRGFFLMLGGPAVLLVASLFYRSLARLPEFISLIIGGIAFFLPLVGVILCIKAFKHRDQLFKAERALVIITFVMCNPLFYFVYFFICYVSGFALGGSALM